MLPAVHIPAGRNEADALFRRQIDWVVHCGYQAVLLIDHPHVNVSSNYWTDAHLIAQALESPSMRFTQLWLEVEASAAGWSRWNAVRESLGSAGKNRTLLQLALRLSDDPTVDAPTMLEQWRAEPVAALIIPCELLSGSKERRLPAAVKAAVHSLLLMHSIDSSADQRYRLPAVMLRTAAAADLIDSFDVAIYNQLRSQLRQLIQSQPLTAIASHQSSPTIARFAQGYEDVLQSPLQPLQDNLDAATYEVFMQDPVKYALYQEAIYYALEERMSGRHNPIDILVVGAGSRGPLVECCLRAIRELNCHHSIGRLMAVEKNPNALITLRAHAKASAEWQALGDRLQVFGGDIRTVQLPGKADLIISELLGSFGDNELSPECLDAAQIWLRKGGCFIPRNSRSFVAPLSSVRLHNRVAQLPGDRHPAAYETPYIVYFSRVNDRICPPQQVWEFNHPVADSNGNNQRCACLHFQITRYPTVLHGFAGYFESVLWESDTCRVVQSIHPSTHSPDMTSWFPMYFPLRNPISVTIGDSVEFRLWRCTDQRRVWYEWACSVNGQPRSFIHNQNGRGFSIGLQI